VIVQTAPAESAATQREPVQPPGTGLRVDDELNVDPGPLGEVTGGLLKKRILRFNRLSREEKVEQIIAGTLRYGPYAAFALLPAFALLLKMLYFGRRRRYPSRPGLYGEHLVFAAHTHAFLFLTGTALVAVSVALARWLVAAWIVIYLVAALRDVYAGSWLGTFVRSAVMVITYTILFALATAALIAVAILLR